MLGVFSQGYELKVASDLNLVGACVRLHLDLKRVLFDESFCLLSSRLARAISFIRTWCFGPVSQIARGIIFESMNRTETIWTKLSPQVDFAHLPTPSNTPAYVHALVLHSLANSSTRLLFKSNSAMSLSKFLLHLPC